MRTISAGASLALDDFVLETFGQSNASGAVLLSSDDALLVTSRTYNDAVSGTYGQLVPALPPDAAMSAVRNGRLLGLSQSSAETVGFRTNAGLTNATDAVADLTIALYDGTGHHLGDARQSLEAFEYVQIDRIFRKVTASAVENGYAVIGTTTEAAAFYAYASVVDNRSGDPVNIPALW